MVPGGRCDVARVHRRTSGPDHFAYEGPGWIVGRAFDSSDVVIFPARVGSYPYGSLESVVWHEVVHLALSAQAGDRPLPRWFHEGVAMSVEKGWGVTSQVRLLLATGGHPGLADLGRLFDSEAQLETASAYLLAAALVSDMRRRHGAAAPGATCTSRSTEPAKGSFHWSRRRPSAGWMSLKAG